MAADYRYLLGDLLTNTINMELPLYGVTYGRRLNKAGNGTFSYNLGNEGINDADVLSCTIPGRSCLWIERNGSLTWGGIIWTRTYESQASSFSCTAQTFESFFYKQYIEATITKTNIDQRQILIDLVTHMQAKTSANIGILYPVAPNSLTAIPRTLTFDPYQMWSYGRAIEYLVNYADGMDYRIDVAYDSSGNPTKQLVTDNILGAPLTSTQVVYDYPGNLKNYWYPENAADGAVTVLGYGAGDNAAMKRSKYSQNALLAAGFPDLQQTFSNKDVSIQATLDSQTLAEANRLYLPVTVPTLEANPEMEPQLGSFNLGDYAQIHIQDLRFPDGYDFLARVVGWDAKPSSSGGLEELKLITAGEDATS